MKKYIYKVSLLFSLLAFMGCDNGLEELNVDPNRPAEVPAGGLFNSTNKSLMTNTRSGFPSGRMALPWVQYSAQRNYTDEDLYQFRVGVNQSLYQNIFLAAKAYKSIALTASDKNQSLVATYGTPVNMLAAARIMLVYSQLQALEIYGDIPYYSFGSKDPDFQGLTLGESNEKATPVFASQEKIYKDMLKELKEASLAINVNATIFNQGDFLFKKGEKMKRFANSLRLKIANRVKTVIPEANEHIQDAIQSGLMLSNEDTVELIFQNDKINPAPFYRDAFIGNRNDFSPTNTFVELLKGEEKMIGKTNPFKGIVDPRLYKMVAPVSQLLEVEEGGKKVMKEVPLRFAYSSSIPSIEGNNYKDREPKFYVGLPVGIPSSYVASQRPSSSQFSGIVYKADRAEVLMEYAEVEFLLSEINNWNDEHYKNGIKASMERWGVEASKIQEFLAKVPTASEENVLTQKYISLFMQPYEAWAEYRRTKFPKTFILPGETRKLNAPLKQIDKSGKEVVIEEYTFNAWEGLKDLPERINYSIDLNLVNKKNKDEAAARIGGDQMSSKLIFAKK